MSNDLIYTQASLERYTRDRKKTDLCIVITAGIPTIIGSESPKILIEKGLAGSQVELTQTNIDDLLGVTDDVDASLAFGATAMVANDTLGFVLACDGQIESIDICRGDVDGTSALVEDVASLPNSAFTGLEILVTPAGNLAGRYQATNITAGATNTLGILEIYLRLK
ncbi:MAG: hypothetical protein OQJ93_09440 [Ignavibacteriaceae bacterium]|nr:hypothetical protein [Ignavibacteriaceae bacterium]